ncbi:hypothetical protein [Aliamphritea spongicola]|nr:hypothetical protein [Aliamphritea spongicola]
MFNKHAAVLPIKIGEPVAYGQIEKLPLNNRERVKLIRRHLYRLAKGKSLYSSRKNHQPSAGPASPETGTAQQ